MTRTQPSRVSQRDLALRVGSYDRLVGVVVSLLVLIGSSVVVIFLLWLTQSSASYELIRGHLSLRPGDGNERLTESSPEPGADLESPRQEELADASDLPIDRLLATVPSAVSWVSANLSVPPGSTGGSGEGSGDRRLAGPAGPAGQDSASSVPRWERWEIHWQTESLSGYAAQLDHFQIELGALGNSPLVDYASQFTAAHPRTRSGPASAESRLYMSWKRGRLRWFDRSLLSKAGVSTDGRILVQFYSDSVERQLLALETAHARAAGHAVEGDILKTVFGVRRVEGGYELFVERQHYRTRQP